jgi:hypothetical protein
VPTFADTGCHEKVSTFFQLWEFDKEENSANERSKCYCEPESDTDECKYVMGGRL